MDRMKDLAGQIVKKPKKDLSRQNKYAEEKKYRRDQGNFVATESKKDAQGASCYILLHAATETCDRIKILSQQHFQVTTENAIWARILRIHNVALNLGPKLLGLYK